MASGKVNVGSPTAGKLNIFTGLGEPSSKEGIWIQTDSSYNNIIVDNEIYLANQWSDIAIYPSAPLTSGATGIYHNHNGKIYVFEDNTASKKGYVYNTTTSQWESITNMPMGLIAFSVVSKDDYIYVYGGKTSVSGTGVAVLYRYSVTTNSWVTLTSAPLGRYNCGMVICDNYIYIIGGESASSSSTGRVEFFRYDIVNDTWKILANYVELIHQPQVSLIGSHIWVSGGTSGTSRRTKMSRYNIALDTWEVKGTMPGISYGYWMYALGTDLYLPITTVSIGINKYDTIQNTWTLITPINRGGFYDTVMLSGKIYEFKTNTFFSFTAKPYQDKSVVLFRNDSIFGSYYTELITPKNLSGTFPRLATGFNDAWIYKDFDLQEYPTYYGDGVKWVKFKN